MQIKPLYLVTVLIVLFNSQIFRKAGANPIGVSGVQEVFYGFLLVWAFGSIVKQYMTRGRVKQLDLFVFLIVVGLPIYSSVLALIYFDQPIIYGLIEERRLLALLVYFPIVTALNNSWVTLKQLEDLTISVAMLAATLTLAVYVGLIPEINDVRQRESSLRGDRYGIGQHFIAVAILLLLARSKLSSFHIRQLLAASMFLVLIAIVQTRQITFGLAASLLVMMKNVRVVLSLLVVASLLAILVLVSPDVSAFLQIYGLVIQDGLTEEYFTQSWRAQAVLVALNSFWGTGFFGVGALFLAWEGGFHRIHGPFFFLADIGIIGSIYRYGIFGIFVYLIYFVVQFRLLFKIEKKDKRILYLSLFAMIVVGAPLSAPFEYRGFLTGFLLAISAHLVSKNSMSARN